ncbi:hypothetical protein ACOSP7_004096 [Xanthoceras sorbifolium]
MEGVADLRDLACHPTGFAVQIDGRALVLRSVWKSSWWCKSMERVADLRDLACHPTGFAVQIDGRALGKGKVLNLALFVVTI